MTSERSTPSELERAVRDAWPGCDVTRLHSDPFEEFRVDICEQMNAVVTGHWAAEGHPETNVWIELKGQKLAAADVVGSAAAIAAAKKQARERLREWDRALGWEDVRLG